MNTRILTLLLALLPAPTLAETVFRAMIEDENGVPLVAERGDALGVRWGAMTENDVAVRGGEIAPTHMSRPQGLLTARRNGCRIERELRPRQGWNGHSATPGLTVWSLDTDTLPDNVRRKLKLVGEGEDADTALLAPLKTMPIADYSAALAQTAPLWSKVPAPLKPCP